MIEPMTDEQIQQADALRADEAEKRLHVIDYVNPGQKLIKGHKSGIVRPVFGEYWSQWEKDYCIKLHLLGLSNGDISSRFKSPKRNEEAIRCFLRKAKRRGLIEAYEANGSCAKTPARGQLEIPMASDGATIQ